MGKKLEIPSYYESDDMALDDTPKLCPKCQRTGHFQITLIHEYDGLSHELLKTHKEVYCGYGCELFDDDKAAKPYLNKVALKHEIMNSRARLLESSLEVINDCINPYLHGLNCLYIHWQAIEGGYSVFYDYYLEHGYQGRDSEVGKKDMLPQKKKPTSREAKLLLYNWMIERFELLTEGKR